MPILAIIALTHVPILHPKSIGIARFIVIPFVDARAIKIPVVADELCKSAVNANPVIIPIYQLSPTASIRLVN